MASVLPHSASVAARARPARAARAWARRASTSMPCVEGAARSGWMPAARLELEPRQRRDDRARERGRVVGRHPHAGDVEAHVDCRHARIHHLRSLPQPRGARHRGPQRYRPSRSPAGAAPSACASLQRTIASPQAFAVRGSTSKIVNRAARGCGCAGASCRRRRGRARPGRSPARQRHGEPVQVGQFRHRTVRGAASWRRHALRPRATPATRGRGRRPGERVLGGFPPARVHSQCE